MFKYSWPVWLNRNLLGFGFASLFSDTNHEIVPLVLPRFIVQLVGSHAAPQILGLISGASSAIASITGLLTGWLSDRLTNRKPLIVLGYFLTGTLVGLLAFAQHWEAVFVLMTLGWFGRGLISTPRSAIIADSVSPAYYGHAFGFRQALDTVGSICGPLIVYLLASWPLKSIFLIALIPGTLALLSVIFFIHENPRKIEKSAPWVSLKELPRSFYLFLGAFLLFGLGNFNKTLLLLRMQTMLESSKSTSNALSALTLLYMYRNIIQALASYGMGALSDRIDSRFLLAVFGFGFFGIMSLLLIWPFEGYLYNILIFTLSGMSAGTYMTLEKSIAAELLPEGIRGTGYGILQTIDSIGDLLSSVMVGLLWTALYPEASFFYAALLSFASIPLLLSCKKTSNY